MRGSPGPTAFNRCVCSSPVFLCACTGCLAIAGTTGKQRRTKRTAVTKRRWARDPLFLPFSPPPPVPFLASGDIERACKLFPIDAAPQIDRDAENRSVLKDRFPEVRDRSNRDRRSDDRKLQKLDLRPFLLPLRANSRADLCSLLHARASITSPFHCLAYLRTRRIKCWGISKHVEIISRNAHCPATFTPGAFIDKRENRDTRIAIPILTSPLKIMHVRNC